MDYNFTHLLPEHLAWHETLEIHELVASQSIGLIKLKKAFHEVADPALRELYTEAITSISKNIQELLSFYPMAPSPEREEEERNDGSLLYSGELLALVKCAVRNYSIAITETATPSLRNVLTKQLLGAIDLHEKIFMFMFERGNYSAYNLNQLLQSDINLANKALSIP